MSDKNAEIRVKFEIGEIKFETEGSADLVERERSIFTNTLLPSAVEAIVRTRGVAQAPQYLDTVEQSGTLLPAGEDTSIENTVPSVLSSADLSRTNLSSFLLPYGELTDLDFVLAAAYYDEKKNEAKSFTSDSVKEYYVEARRKKYSNNSDLLQRLVKKGYIMDAPNAEKKMPKPYILTDVGIRYIESYQSKEKGEEKPKSTKTRKPRTLTKSTYADINCDDLNLDKYPSVKSLKEFKDKMMMVLYIITNEDKGEWFTTNDVLCLLTDVFGECATKDQVNGIFKREKLWFKTENVEGNGKEVKRKLLNQGIDFAKKITDAKTKTD